MKSSLFPNRLETANEAAEIATASNSGDFKRDLILSASTGFMSAIAAGHKATFLAEQLRQFADTFMGRDPLVGCVPAHIERPLAPNTMNKICDSSGCFTKTIRVDPTVFFAGNDEEKQKIATNQITTSGLATIISWKITGHTSDSVFIEIAGHYSPAEF